MTELDPERLDLAGPRLLRDALEAERGEPGPDPARLRRIEAALEGAPVAATAAGRGPWLLGGALGLAALVSLGLVVARPRPAAPSATEPVAVVAPPPPAVPPVVTAPTPTAPTPAAPTATVAIAAIASAAEAPSAAPPSVPAAKAPRPPTGRSETDEMTLVARAQEAMRGRPAEALALCREHERTFATGHFVQEREAIAIEALVYQKRTAEAARRWRAFERAYPTSSHRTHLAALFTPSAEPGSAAP